MKITTGTNQRIEIHDEADCAGMHCPFHNPSDHLMIDWPTHIRQDAFAFPLVERICEDGTGHPDPDSVNYLNEFGPEGARGSWGIHGCCGCCSGRIT